MGILVQNLAPTVERVMVDGCQRGRIGGPKSSIGSRNGNWNGQTTWARLSGKSMSLITSYFMILNFLISYIDETFRMENFVLGTGRLDGSNKRARVETPSGSSEGALASLTQCLFHLCQGFSI